MNAPDLVPAHWQKGHLCAHMVHACAQGAPVCACSVQQAFTLYQGVMAF